jgi:hypothetical protein
MALERRLAAALGAGVALGLAVFAGGASLASGAESVRAPRAFTVQLLSRNDSDMTGTARFVPRGKRSFVVVVTVQGGPGGGAYGYMAHIHTGPCSKEPTIDRPRIAEGLHNVKGNRSRTTVRHSLARYRRAKYSLNVHEPSGQYRPIACGDLPRRF